MQEFVMVLEAPSCTVVHRVEGDGVELVEHVLSSDITPQLPRAQKQGSEDP